MAVARPTPRRGPPVAKAPPAFRQAAPGVPFQRGLDDDILHRACEPSPVCPLHPLSLIPRRVQAFEHHEASKSSRRAYTGIPGLEALRHRLLRCAPLGTVRRGDTAQRGEPNPPAHGVAPLQADTTHSAPERPAVRVYDMRLDASPLLHMRYASPPSFLSLSATPFSAACEISRPLPWARLPIDSSALIRARRVTNAGAGRRLREKGIHTRCAPPSPSSPSLPLFFFFILPSSSFHARAYGTADHAADASYLSAERAAESGYAARESQLRPTGRAPRPRVP
ncbi:hypothetical protein DFH06DRAFT_1328520 [Mycena polygramma]|nr:hypothetical protein DFH06DRAFT_1328520 [Mycena polygramma]